MDQASDIKSYRLTRLELENHDGKVKVQLNASFDDLLIYESIFAPYLSGTVTVKDSSNMFAAFPLIGQEKLTIEWEDSKNQTIRRHVFSVYGIENRTPINTSSVYSFTLKFISPEALVNNNIHASDFFTGVKLSEIAKTMFKKLGSTKTIAAEDTDVNHDLVIPNFTPMGAIEWLSRFATSKSNPNSTYVFYEDKDKFQFVSLGSLLKGTVKKKLSVVMKMLEKTEEGNKYDGMSAFSINQYDVLKASVDNIFYQNLKVIDTVVRKVDNREYDYSRDYGNFARLGSNQFSSSGFVTSDAEPLKILKNKKLKTQTVKVATTRSFMVNDTYIKAKQKTTNYVKKKEDAELTRNAELLQLDYLRIFATIPGDATLTVGQLVEAKIPASSKDSGDISDKFVSGNYLIGGISHRFHLNEYEQKIELMRNCLSAGVVKNDST